MPVSGAPPKPPAGSSQRLPLWAWGAAAAAGLVIGFLFLRGGSARAADGEDGSATSGDGGDSGSGAVGAEYVVPGDLLSALGLYPGGGYYPEGGDSGTGFAESFDTSSSDPSSSLVRGGSTPEAVAAAQSYGWNVYNIPSASGGSVPYATDVGGQGAYVQPSGSVFEGRLPSYSTAPSSPNPAPGVIRQGPGGTQFQSSGQGGRFIVD